MTRAIELYSHEDRYQIEGNSHVIIWKSKGDVLIETPEMGFRGGLDHKSIQGFSLDEKTQELSVQFLQSGRANQINIGRIEDYAAAFEWLGVVNKLYVRD